jgi:hypothetical protein
MRFEDFVIINEKIDLDDVSISVDNADQNFMSNLIDNFSFIVSKRIIKNIRPKKITGYLKRQDGKGDRSTLSIIMNNKDFIVGTFSNGNLAISINSEIIYDVDRKDFDENKLVNKLSEEYVKYLKSNNYQVKRNN